MGWIIIGIIAFLLVCFRDDAWNTISTLIVLALMILCVVITGNIFIGMLLLGVIAIFIIFSAGGFDSNEKSEEKNDSTSRQLEYEIRIRRIELDDWAAGRGYSDWYKKKFIETVGHPVDLSNPGEIKAAIDEVIAREFNDKSD